MTWRWPWQAPVFDPAPGDLIEWEGTNHPLPTMLRGVFVRWDGDRAVVTRRDGSEETVPLWRNPRVIQLHAPAELEVPKGYR